MGKEPNSETEEVERKKPMEPILRSTEYLSHQKLVQSDHIEEQDPPPEIVKSAETARDSTGSGHDLELAASKEAVATVSPVCKASSMPTKQTEADPEKVGDQRSKESHIDASQDRSAKPNIGENLAEKETLEKPTDISGSPASQHPDEAGDAAVGGSSEKKVGERVFPDAVQDDVGSGRQMSSNGASVEASTEGKILNDVSSSMNRSELSPPTTDVTPPPPPPPDSDLLPQQTQPTDPANCPPVETVASQPDCQKANSQISQEQEEIPDGQHDSNSLNNSQDGDVEITNHQKGTQSIKSVPADKLMNGHKCTTANLQSQTEEKEEKTTGSFESTKLAATIQSVSSAVTSPSNPPCTSSSLPIDPKSTLVSLEERLATCGLPEAVEDAEFDNKLKVFTNYRNFGAMYQSKNNFKKAEWAFKNGIKQAGPHEAWSTV